MNYPTELCRLVIRNMEVIETAPAVVEVTEKRLFSAINARIEKAINSKRGWKGCYDLLTNSKDPQTTFAPEDWPENKDKSYGAYYTLTYMEAFEVDAWLAYATGVKGAALCFAFALDSEWSGLTTKEYKRQLANFYAGNSALQKTGFSLAPSEESIIRPFSFAADTLADEYPDFDSALEPLDAALKNLFKAHDEFNKFVKDVKKSK